MDNLMEVLLDKLGRIENSLSLTKPILNINEVSEFTGISKSTLYKLTSAREIPHYKKARHLIFDREEVMNWLKSNRISTKDALEVEVNSFLLKTK